MAAPTAILVKKTGTSLVASVFRFGVCGVVEDDWELFCYGWSGPRRVRRPTRRAGAPTPSAPSVPCGRAGAGSCRLPPDARRPRPPPTRGRRRPPRGPRWSGSPRPPTWSGLGHPRTARPAEQGGHAPQRRAEAATPTRGTVRRTRAPPPQPRTHSATKRVGAALEADAGGPAGSGRQRRREQRGGHTARRRRTPRGVTAARASAARRPAAAPTRAGPRPPRFTAAPASVRRPWGPRGAPSGRSGSRTAVARGGLPRRCCRRVRAATTGAQRPRRRSDGADGGFLGFFFLRARVRVTTPVEQRCCSTACPLGSQVQPRLGWMEHQFQRFRSGSTPPRSKRRPRVPARCPRARATPSSPPRRRAGRAPRRHALGCGRAPATAALATAHPAGGRILSVPMVGLVCLFPRWSDEVRVWCSAQACVGPPPRRPPQRRMIDCGRIYITRRGPIAARAERNFTLLYFLLTLVWAWRAVVAAARSAPRGADGRAGPSDAAVGSGTRSCAPCVGC